MTASDLKKDSAYFQSDQVIRIRIASSPASATLKIDSYYRSKTNHMGAKKSISEDGLVMSTATRALRDYCTPHPRCGGMGVSCDLGDKSTVLRST